MSRLYKNADLGAMALAMVKAAAAQPGVEFKLGLKRKKRVVRSTTRKAWPRAKGKPRRMEITHPGANRWFMVEEVGA